MPSRALERAPEVEPADRAEWREWLAANHGTAAGVWLVGWRPSAHRPGLAYEDAIQEALCFGWVDGQGAGIDALRSKLYFAPRRPRSAWAGSNKRRVEQLLAAGLMAPAGLAAVERAKSDGTWTVLDGPERLEVPDDLAAALDHRPGARAGWEAIAPSMRQMLLGAIAIARRPETQTRRVEAAVEAAVAKAAQGGGPARGRRRDAPAPQRPG
jgi:uncharacterized protein YdeI (YjbR/CyaY-like superfamily)